MLKHNGMFSTKKNYAQCPKHSGRNMSQCHIFLYKSHMVCLRVKPGSPRLEAWAMARAILCGYYIYRLFWHSTLVSIYYTTQFRWSEPVHCDVGFSARISAWRRRTVLFRNEARRCRSGTLYSTRQTLAGIAKLPFITHAGSLVDLDCPQSGC
jgi:hypothetical protein